MKGQKKYQGLICILVAVLMMVVSIPWSASADGEIIYLKGVSTRPLEESGEIGLSVCATNGLGDGVSIKPTDLQLQINGQPVEARIDNDSRRGYIFVVDYSLSLENKRWTYATEATAGLISGLLNLADIKDEVTVVWVSENNQTETISADNLETTYRVKRESIKSNIAHLYDGINQAIDLAQTGTGGYDYYDIYVITDGLDTGSRVTLDYLSKRVQDGNSPISLFVCCYYNGSRALENRTSAESARKALMQFTTYLDGIYDSFDIQRTSVVGTYVKRAINKYSNAMYGLMNVRVALNNVQLDRKNGQTEIYVGVVSGSTAKRKTIYLPVEKLPAPTQIEPSQPQDFQAIIEEKQAQIDTLVSGAALKDAKINALEKTIEEQTAATDSLKTDLAEKIAKIETLETDVTEKAEKIKALEDGAAKAAAQIKSLEESAAKQTAKIETLEADITGKASKIESLEAEVTEKTTKIETLETDVAGKASKIETLEKDIADKAARIETLEKDVANKATRIETLEKDVSEKAAKIQSLEANVAEKAEKIKTLEADIAEKAAQITTLLTELSAKNTEIGTLQASVNDRDAKIETLTATVSEKTTQIETLEADVADKQTRIDNLMNSNRAQAAQLQVFKQKILEEGIAAGYSGTKSLQVIMPTRDYIIERISMIPDVATVAAVTVDNDPNGQLGKEGQYIEQIYFSSPLVDPEYSSKSDFDVIGAGTACGGSIEVYRTIPDAMERDNHLAYYDGSSSSSGSHVVVGTVVIRTSSSLALVDQRKLEKEIIEALTVE